MNKFSMIMTCTLETPLGTIRAAADEQESLCGLWFIDQKYYPQNTGSWIERPDCPVFGELAAWLAGYFSKSKNLPALPLAPAGTAFQQSVWKLLIDIPYGTTRTYGDIAKEIAGTGTVPGMFTRAVAGAIGHNPVSLVIPCHRVIGSDGSLKGYAGGIERKRALLEMER
jgi:methylated-DNA-[protein]-cysteine S-methyltransferase